MGFARLIFLLAVVSYSFAQTYNTRYDNIDIDRILASKRLLDSYIHCLLDDNFKKCSPEGREFKKYIPEAIHTNCGKCSDSQKRIVKKAAKHIIQNRPQDWDKIRKKYDPERKYQQSFNTFLNSP
nr:chemosensory protein 9 [Ophraella communa]